MKVAKRKLRDIKAVLLLVISAVLLVTSVSVETYPGDASFASQKVGKTLAKRMTVLDTLSVRALESDHSKWLELGDVPDDMVIYRYLSDTLQSWNNQFTVSNDDISQKIVFQRISNLKESIVSPLSEVTETPSYVNYGPKWYLVKQIERDDCKIISGLEISNTLDDRSFNGVNPRFRLSDKFTIQPLSNADGEVVMLGEVPVFKILCESSTAMTSASNTILVWLAFLFFIAAGLLFLNNKRTVRRFLIVIAGLLASMVGLYYHGIAVQSDVELFSPTVYADGGLFRSLGAVVIINLFIDFFVLCCFMMRRMAFRSIFKAQSVRVLLLHSMLIVLIIAGVCVYTFLVFKSIIMNSSITLELYKINEISIYTAVVYLSFILLLMTVPLLLSMLMPLLKKIQLVSFKHPLTRRGRLVFAFCVSLFFVLSSAILGFKKEQDRVDVWVNRLSMDRDVNLELRLCSVENDIATDFVIASLTGVPNSNGIILNRISENHLLRVSQDYTISVVIVDDSNSNNPAVVSFFNERIRGGAPIADGSRFTYLRDNNGQAHYTGMFIYYNEMIGVTRLLVSIEPKANKDGVGYSNILGYSSTGRVVIPARYAYARYVNGNLATFKGSFAYPTVLTDRLKGYIGEDGRGHYLNDGYSHIIKEVAEDEVIVMSRPVVERNNYFVAAFFIGVVSYLCSRVLTIGRRVRRKQKDRNYYKSRINAILMASLVITLIVLAGLSIMFVYQRNDANRKTLMSDRISSIQSLLQERCRYAWDFMDLNTMEMAAVLEDIGSSTSSDITLYTTGGKAFRSTNAEVFDRMLLGTRMDEDAYDHIVYRSRRYFIGKDSFGTHRYHSLYAPIINSSGKMIAIMCSPYSDETYDFETAAVMHMVTIFTVFIILLLIARFTVLALVDRMFKPLTEMGRKMNAADINNLQYIIYERNDEISPLVRAYNLMVHDLSNSTKQLAQAERDKAWSDMARRVAHEIKNPLTPMKLQLQRVINLKQRGNPVWQERFDEASKIFLEQIDVLSDTANEFSTFAKLYSEEHTSIDLDKLLHDQVELFNNRDSFTISYYGLEGVTVTGPKPQFTRVIVNLITNSIQAIEIYREESGDDKMGEIIVSLRNSVKEGFYDIVVEDNGPGVKDENRSKLFVPEFTTKSSGSGLGLAISRNIVEKCGGEIFYSKSFTLQGACFTVRYPKTK